MNKKPSDWMKYSGLGIQMAASVVICLYIGKWVGIKFGSENLGALFGTLFGSIASIYNLIKQIEN
jgi:F0F1-type ATP synthase assembly protein I